MKTKTIKCLDCNKRIKNTAQRKTKRCDSCARNERIRLSAIFNDKKRQKELTKTKTAHLKVFMGIGEYADQIL